MKTHTPNHLNNVCIMRKYHDSERFFECVKEFDESEKFIINAVNSHDQLVEALKRSIEIIRETEKENDPFDHDEYYDYLKDMEIVLLKADGKE